MKANNPSIFAASLALFTLSCSGPSTNENNKSYSDSQEEIAEFENYNPFPDATTVRLFVQSNPFEEDDISRLKDFQGRLLSAEEADIFISAFSKKTVIQPPAEGYMETGCAFVPRHVFRFYDKGNKRLGDAFVCFECYAVELEPPGALAEVSFPEKGQSLLQVNYSTLVTLLRRMNVPTYAHR